MLRNKAFNFARNPTYDGYQRAFASMTYKLQWLMNQLLENFEKRKV